MDDAELVRKRNMFNAMMELDKFLLKAGFDHLYERPSQEFLKEMMLFAGIEGSTKYLKYLARKFQHLNKWLKKSL